MKVLVIGKKERYEKYMPDMEIARTAEIAYAKMNGDPTETASLAPDAEAIFADAIAPVSADLINRLPKLKLIHSEGVGYNGIDMDAAAKRGILVCNNRGINATAVAEQTILLILGLTRSVIEGNEAEYRGQQMQMKLSKMESGIAELADLTVGLVGFGDIAKETARILNAFGSRVVYFSRTRKDEETEKKYNVTYMPLDELLRISDVVSMHVPVTDETRGMANDSFFEKMKPTAYFINTARGEVADNEALKNALIEGKIGGAGIDTLAPEPVTEDNPMLDLPEEVKKKVLFSPHLGGITESTFKRAHRNLWKAAEDVRKGITPKNVLNR